MPALSAGISRRTGGLTFSNGVGKGKCASAPKRDDAFMAFTFINPNVKNSELTYLTDNPGVGD